MKVLVDLDSYCLAYNEYNTEIVRRSWGDCKDWEEMDVVPEQLKDMIDKCVHIKMLEPDGN